MLRLIFTVLKSVFIPTPRAIGNAGESRVIYSSTKHLSAPDYIQFHNVILPTSYGTTQIDHIIISRYGVFVVETKNMAGWIFGGAYQRQWTQVLYEDSFKFQNPLHQNNTHISAVQATTKVHPGVIQSIVLFVGDSTFKTEMPTNVMHGSRFIGYIRSFTKDVLSHNEVQTAASRIEQARIESNQESEQRHVMRLRNRPRPSSEQKCPICGKDMVLRVARTGFRAGKNFWGCSRYPTCRGIRNVD